MAAPSIEELDLLHANICKALGDTTRIQILYALHERPIHVSALAEMLDVPQSTVSRHLAILRERALVSPERDGAVVVYSLTDPEIIEILDAMREVLRRVVERRSQMMA